MTIRKLKIGLLGCGTVGRGLVELVGWNEALIRQRSGIELRITKILVRDLDKERHGPKTGTYGQQYSCVFARPETAESVEHGRAE